MEDLQGTSSENSLNSSHRFCGTELERMKRVLGFSRRFTVVSIVEPIMAIAGVTSLLPHTTKWFKVPLPIAEVSFLYAV